MMHEGDGEDVNCPYLDYPRIRAKSLTWSWEPQLGSRSYDGLCYRIAKIGDNHQRPLTGNQMVFDGPHRFVVANTQKVQCNKKDNLEVFADVSPSGNF
jgi:hypothetical protein